MYWLGNSDISILFCVLREETLKFSSSSVDFEGSCRRRNHLRRRRHRHHHHRHHRHHHPYYFSVTLDIHIHARNFVRNTV
jgi:hypothetical protein